jgi:hypothetical protein
METLLLQDPWIAFYLLYVGVLGAFFIWDYLRRTSAIQDGAGPARNVPIRGGAVPPRGYGVPTPAFWSPTARQSTERLYRLPSAARRNPVRSRGWGSGWIRR